MLGQSKSCLNQRRLAGKKLKDLTLKSEIISSLPPRMAVAYLLAKGTDPAKIVEVLSITGDAQISKLPTQLGALPGGTLPGRPFPDPCVFLSQTSQTSQTSGSGSLAKVAMGTFPNSTRVEWKARGSLLGSCCGG